MGSRIGHHSFGGLGCDQVAAPESCKFSPAYSCSIERKDAHLHNIERPGKQYSKGLAGLRIQSIPVSFMATHQEHTKWFSSWASILALQRFYYPATSDSFLAQQYVAGVRSAGVAEEQGMRTWRVSRIQGLCNSCLWKGWCGQCDDRCASLVSTRHRGTCFQDMCFLCSCAVSGCSQPLPFAQHLHFQHNRFISNRFASCLEGDEATALHDSAGWDVS